MSQPHFVTPQIQDNPTGWGPCQIPDHFKDMPYQPFAKDVRLGKDSQLLFHVFIGSATVTAGNTYQDKRYLG
ncbi:unnamed protein product, partial [Candidula unifasciata]